jgi:hypothetical protein
MKRLPKFFTITAFLISPAIVFCQDSTAIVFEDPVVETSVREQLKWSGLSKDQPITKDHIEDISFLSFEGEGEERVRNLSDLRHFTNLRTLEIWNASGITSFDPIWKVDSINYLYIYGARNPDFSGISVLSQLRILDLSDCTLDDLGFVISSNFTELHSLVLEANYLDLTADSNDSLQIITLKQLVQDNRNSKIKAGLYLEENGMGKLQIGDLGYLRMEPWSTDPAVTYGMQIPKAVQSLANEISHIDKSLLANPNDPQANLLQGIHTFFNIAETTKKYGLKEFLISLGVEPSIRSFTLADTSIAGNFDFELNRDFNASLLTQHLENGIIPSLMESDSYFARIPVNSVITLEPKFTGTEKLISVDYADILVLRSMVKILSGLACIQTGYDWNLNAGFLRDQSGEDINSTMQSFRMHNPNLLGIRNKEQLAKARKFLEDGIALYLIASPILTHESRLGSEEQSSPDRLFVIEKESLADEIEFRNDLNDLLKALHEPHGLSKEESDSGILTTQSSVQFTDRDIGKQIGIIDLNPFFEGKVDLAQLLPTSSGDRFETHQFRDPTFGGLFPTLNPKRLSTILYEEELIINQQAHPHDTLVEALKHFDPDAYMSLNEDLKAKYGTDTIASLDHFKTTGYLEGRRYFLWPFEKVDFPITLTDPTTASGQVILLNGHLLSTGGSNFTKVGFVISSEGLLPRYDLGWEVHQSALNPQSSFSLAYQPMKFDTTYYYRSYAENEAGRWFGSVKKFNSVQGKTKLTSLYEESRALGNGWYENPWFGILNLPKNGWSYHFGLGWIYLPEGNEEGNWMWSEQRKGWIWTRSDIWPHFWEHNQASWVYFKKTENKTHFFNFSSDSYE